MALMKNADNLARQINVPESTIRAGHHYPSVAGALTGAIEAFMMFVDDAKDLESLKAMIHSVFDKFMEEESK